MTKTDFYDILKGDKIRLKHPESGTELTLTVSSFYNVGSGIYHVSDSNGFTFSSKSFPEVELIERPVRLPNK